MKKIIALLIVALTGLASTFAFDVGAIEGSWQDSKWGAIYTIGGDTNGKGCVKITNAKTGKLLITLNDTNTTNFKIEASTEGAGFSLYCKATGRKYTFLKPLNLGKDLKLKIDRDWTDEPYEIDITWTSGDAGINGKSLVEGTRNAIDSTKNLAEDVSNFANGFSEK